MTITDERAAPDRRMVLAGVTALAASVPSRARAADAATPATTSPIARGVLAQNALALTFVAAPSQLPPVRIDAQDGTREVREFLAGRSIIMPVWAEWCAPCLAELGDFARLQQKYGNEKFAILPILSGTQKRMTLEVIASLFTYLRASVFKPLMEHGLGSKLVNAMARQGRQLSLPCNLLIAPDATVVARVFGLQGHDGESEGEKPNLIARAEAGQVLSYWGKPEGDEFAQAIANGFLTT